ncbi:MAG TPA: hypothetical protein VGG51_13445 [Candidatus Cybelea sp.]|jgi:hypothetical protein
MMKLHNALLACALGAGWLLGAAAPASAAHVSGGTARVATTARVLPGNRYYGGGSRSYGYRNGYGYAYRPGYGYPYGYGVSVGVGYGYVGGGYGYAPYPAVYGRRAYWAGRPYSRPYRRAYWGRRFVR